MIEETVRDYIRTQSDVMELLNNDEKRVNIDWKGDMRSTHVTLYVGGGGPHEYLPLDNPLIIVHVFGSTRPAAARVAEVIGQAMWRMDAKAAPLLSARVLSTLYVPTTDGVARYVITTFVTARMAVTA